MSNNKGIEAPTPGGRQAKSLRIHGTIARELGAAIVSGRYQPGDALRGEIEASHRLKISRTAYREAMRILAAKGLIISRPKAGTHVNRRAEWHLLDPDVLEWMFEFEPDIAMLENLFELREIIEPAAAALAAKRRTNAHIARMKAGLEDMAKHTLHEAAGRLADRDFHAALLEASANAFLLSLTNGISAAVAWTTEYKERVNPRRYNPDPLPAHQRVLNAIIKRDSDEAREAMLDLISASCFDALKARKSKRRAPSASGLEKFRI
jgi:DNA-binding FadR family transcriptional regulator